MSLKAKQKLKGCTITRVQSSSSINTYRQCPRKYYYSYVEGLPQKPNIYQIRGRIAHQVLEDFFKLDISRLSLNKFDASNFEFSMKILLQDMLSRLWSASEEEFGKLEMSKNEIEGYKQETQHMIQCWFLDFLERLKEYEGLYGFKEAFERLAPVSEEHFLSEEMGVQGYVDAIHKDEDGIKIIDYKTSKKDGMTDDYRLQLSIYSILYHEKYGFYPSKAGLYLLKHGERLLDVEEGLLEFGREELKKIHLCTTSQDVRDYPKKPSFLCKWSTGQCDFHDECQGSRL